MEDKGLRPAQSAKGKCPDVQRQSRRSATLPRHARRYLPALATSAERGESRRSLFTLQPPEQQPLCVIKQHPMGTTELDKDNIIAAVRRTRYQASATYLGVTRFHAGKYRRSNHELICRLQKTRATRTIGKSKTRQPHELAERCVVICGKRDSRHVA